MSAVRCPLLLKIATFSLKGVRKTLPVCPPQSLRTSAVTKLEIIFARTTLEGVLPYKFRRNRLPDSLRSEAIIKKAETSRQGSGSACGTMGLFESYIIPLTMIKESSYIHIIVIFDTPVKHFIAFSMIVIGMPFTYQVEKS